MKIISIISGVEYNSIGEYTISPQSNFMVMQTKLKSLLVVLSMILLSSNGMINSSFSPTNVLSEEDTIQQTDNITNPSTTLTFNPFYCSLSGDDWEPTCDAADTLGKNHNIALQQVLERSNHPSNNINPFYAEDSSSGLIAWLLIRGGSIYDGEMEEMGTVLSYWYDNDYHLESEMDFEKNLFNATFQVLTENRHTDVISDFQALFPDLFTALNSSKSDALQSLDWIGMMDSAFEDDHFGNIANTTAVLITIMYSVMSYSYNYWVGSESQGRAGFPWEAVADAGGMLLGGAIVCGVAACTAGLGVGAAGLITGGTSVAASGVAVGLGGIVAPGGGNPTDYNGQGKYNEYAHSVDILHDTIFEDLKENFQCRDGMSYWSQANIESAERCVSDLLSYAVTNDMIPLTGSEKADMHKQMMGMMSVILQAWYTLENNSEDIDSFSEIIDFIRSNGYTFDMYVIGENLTKFLDCALAKPDGAYCASEFASLDDEELRTATMSRAILGHEYQDEITAARDCTWCGVADGAGMVIGGAIGGALGAGVLSVGTGAIGAGYLGGVFSVGMWAEERGIAPPPGGGTGIDCDLAADKEKCYDMREMVYAHDLILDELNQIWIPGTDDFTWEDATRVLEAAYQIQETEFAYRRCAANLENGAPKGLNEVIFQQRSGSDNITLDNSISQEASARSGPDWPWGSWPPGCPGPYDPTPIDDKFPFLTFGGLNDEIGMCKEGDDTMGRATGIPLYDLLLFIKWILGHIPGEDGFGLSGSSTGFGTMTTEEIRVELSKDWSDGNDEQMQLARMQFTRSSNSDLFAMDSDADEQQLRAIGGMVDALVLYQTHDPAMAAAFSRIVDLVARSATGGYSPNMPVETPLKSCPIGFIESIDIENDEALLRYEIVDVEVEDSDNSTVADDTTVSDDDNDDGFLPGFGFMSTLISLLGVAILLQRKQREDND